MKKILLTFMVCAFMATPALAVPTINFSQSSGDWTYTPSAADTGTISFSDEINVTKGLGSVSDPLVSHLVRIPDLNVTVITSGSVYQLTPDTATFTIVDKTTPATVYFTGTLGTGRWLVNGSTSAYPLIKADITLHSVPTQTSPVSPTLTYINNNPTMWIDLAMSLDLAGTDIGSVVQAGTQTLTDGSVSGSMILIPAPGAILLGGIGVALVGWLRRRRTL